MVRCMGTAYYTLFNCQETEMDTEADKHLHSIGKQRSKNEE